ncbi:interleukin-7 receptor subunit alpha isoform X2 [Plectropomus leopardus]|uniref:interleukin-7 receptor subunit alpha isoform X2 n=1 Tax=Plectropomus leopardus TaxID=160734 RepID=UPI001C4CB6DE|nr:interleukin-7 receptor subunit alpha isoform X2 [Plectropomus leopardus]
MSSNPRSLPESRMSCTSDILMAGSSLSCRLLAGGGGVDDEDEEADGVEKMTVCCVDHSGTQRDYRCVEAAGDTVTSSILHPVHPFNVTVHLKTGRCLNAIVQLKKIVKPRRPWVKNVTFDLDSNQAEIQIQIPYDKDYLTLHNQQFQLKLSEDPRLTALNFSGDTLRLGMDRLRGRSEYAAVVRSLPAKIYEGTWSEWSESFSFRTPPETTETPMDDGPETYKLMVCLVVLVLLPPASVLFFWKNRIFAFIWPKIPHPKHTLVQICGPGKGVLLDFKPEEFSALKVDKSEEQPCDQTEPPIATADGARSDPGSAHSSAHSSAGATSTSSVSTEELELSALLSQGSSDAEDGLQSSEEPEEPEERAGTPPPSSGGHEEAYVTMSSFYQIK